MAGPDVLVSAAPTPCTNRKTISHIPEPENPQTSEERVKITTPDLKSRFIPVKSPQRPIGSKNMAVASKKEVTTQLRLIALRRKLFSIAGKAILIEEIRKVAIKDVIATIIIMRACFFVHCIRIDLILQEPA